MAKVTTTHCDICNAPGAADFQYFESREMDGAGSYENNYGHIDLCLKHAIALLSDFDKHLPASVRLPLVNNYRMRKPQEGK